MNGSDDEEETRWLEVLAKATALLAMQGAKLESRLDEANFLQGLGITRPEAAKMLGVAQSTLRNLAHQQRGRSGKSKKS